MGGFGNWPFGYGPFGRYHWSRHVLWEDLPVSDRDADESGDLERFIESVRGLFAELLAFADGLATLRDPETVRSLPDETHSVTVTSVSLAGQWDAEVYDVELAADLPARVSVGWSLVDGDDRVYEVQAVHRVEKKLAVHGDAPPKLGPAKLSAPPMIGLLAAEYGTWWDSNEPARFQRSAIARAYQWMSCKGAAVSYDIIAKMAGYRVDPQRLWAIDGPPFHTAIPPASIFEVPHGSGRYYTDLEPRLPLFDEVAADVVQLDRFCWEAGIQALLSANMTGLSVLAITSLPSGRWRIRVTSASIDMSAVAYPGHWYARRTTNPEDRFWLETVPEEDPMNPGQWLFEIAAQPPFGVGATLDVAYECPLVIECGFCAASAIVFGITTAEVVTEPEPLGPDWTRRISDKLGRAIPVHVRVAAHEYTITPFAVLGGSGHMAASGTVTVT